MIIALLLFACSTAPQAPPAQALDAADFVGQRRLVACQHGQRCGAPPATCTTGEPPGQPQLEGCEYDPTVAAACLDGWRQAACPTGDPAAWIAAQPFDVACFTALVCPSWAVMRDDLLPPPSATPRANPPRVGRVTIAADGIAINGSKLMRIREGTIAPELRDDLLFPPLTEGLNRFAADAPTLALTAHHAAPYDSVWLTLAAMTATGKPTHLVLVDPRSPDGDYRWREAGYAATATPQAPAGAVGWHTTAQGDRPEGSTLYITADGSTPWGEVWARIDRDLTSQTLVFGPPPAAD